MLDPATAHLLMGVFEHTLDMRVRVEYGEAQAWVRTLGSYNQFDGLAAAEMLTTIDSIMPRAVYPDVDGRPNPNNGLRTYSIEIGRESSPVIYLRRHIYKRDQQLTADQVLSIETAAKAAQADEISYRYEKGSVAQCRMNGREWTEETKTTPDWLPSYLAHIGQEEFRFWWD